MPLSADMPTDPFSAIEESNLQRDIAAIDYGKEHDGTTWVQYVGNTLGLFKLTDHFERSEVLRERVQTIENILPFVERAEQLDDPSFPHLKREVVKEVWDALSVQRELMDTIEVKE